MRRMTLATCFGLAAVAFSVQAHDHHDHHAHHDHHGHHMTDYSAQFAAATLTDQVRVEQCWVRLLPAHIPSAGYFILHNDTEQPIEVLAAATPSYDDVMLHETIEEDGMAKMVMADTIQIPAKGTLTFKPGGLHAMFEQPTGALKVGDTMPMELLLANEQKVSVDCKVNPANARSYD